MSQLRGQPVDLALGLGCVEHSPCPLNCFLQCSWFELLNHIPLQVRVQGFKHVDEERAMEVLADEELVCLDDGMKSGPIPIHLQTVGLHWQLVFLRVKQNLRLQCLHELLPRRELAGGIKKFMSCLSHCHLRILDRNCVQ